MGFLGVGSVSPSSEITRPNHTPQGLLFQKLCKNPLITLSGLKDLGACNTDIGSFSLLPTYLMVRGLASSHLGSSRPLKKRQAGKQGGREGRGVRDWERPGSPG